MSAPLEVSVTACPPQGGWRWQCRRWLLKFDLNLAAFRYTNVLRSDGGLIDHLEDGALEMPEGRFFNVNAFLDARLRPGRPDRQLYSSADGGGTHPNPLIARFIAISEAIERWAFWDRSDSSELDLYGFDIDGSTTGMAAFPGLLTARARSGARNEALERFAIAHWWEGRLPHTRLELGDGLQGIRILVPGASESVVIVYEDDAEQDLRYYGYAAATETVGAVGKALAELVRHRLVVNAFVNRFPQPFLGLAARKIPLLR